MVRWERRGRRDVYSWVDETIDRGKLRCLKDRIAESGRTYYFADTVFITGRPGVERLIAQRRVYHKRKGVC